jgi:hypothetical protein
MSSLLMQLGAGEWVEEVFERLPCPDPAVAVTAGADTAAAVMAVDIGAVAWVSPS